MPVREFDAARRERLRERDPIQFVLQGDTYTCLPAVPIGVGFDLADAPEIGTRGSMQALAAFLDQILIDDDRPRLQQALRRRDDPVDSLALYEIVGWIAEEYAARPTSPSDDSSDGRPTTGPTSSSTPEPRVLATSPI